MIGTATRLNLGTLDGKVAVIAGANSGIGLASAKRFAREGARVFMQTRETLTKSKRQP